MMYYNNILAIEAMDLISNSIMTKAQYHNGVARKQFNILRRGCNSTPCAHSSYNTRHSVPQSADAKPA